MRTGKTRIQEPVLVPDLDDAKLAQSGLRGHIRFVVSGNGVGFYSVRAGARSRQLSRGAIVQIDDREIKYSVVSHPKTRPSDEESKKAKKYGPLLPYAENPGTSGTITVSADLEQAVSARRTDVDMVMLTRDAARQPTKWPFFWSHLNRLSNWLSQDTGPVFYEVSGETAIAYKNLVQTATELGQRGGCYIDHAERPIYGMESTKGNAGASKLLDRRLMEVGTQVAFHFHLNFTPVAFATLDNFVYFLPDEIVVVDSLGNCSFIPYSEISYGVTEGTQMNIPVPNWCEPVGYTWQFMNKDGGPDRRYNYNPQIAHYRVWELDFTFPGGRIDTAFVDQNVLRRFTTCIDHLVKLSKARRV